jgi:hypothetical protein
MLHSQPQQGTHVMDVNSGEPWSDMDVADLIASLDYGDTLAQAATG